MTPRQYMWAAVDMAIDLAARNGIKYRRGDFELVEETVDIVTESEHNLVRGKNIAAHSLLGIVVALRYDFKRTGRKLRDRKLSFGQYVCCTIGRRGLYFKFSHHELKEPYQVQCWAETDEESSEPEEKTVGGCGSCICRECELWWGNHCPHGNCYDNYRAKVRPYDVNHPNKPLRTGWTNWPKEQAYWCRGGVFYPCKSCEHYVPHEKTDEAPEQKVSGQIDLFDFSEEKRGLESRGYKSAWVDMVVDRTDKYAIFERNGKPHYKSQCPLYEGYWLRGGLGSVQCAERSELIPALQWDKFCRNQHEQCPLFAAKNKEK